MQQLISSAVMRMTSIEISDLVGSRHDSVMRTVERLAEGGVISLPPLVEVKTQRERRLETSQTYIFEGEKGKRDSIVVVAQLSPEFTARLVDRWQELESQQVAQKQQTLPALPIEADIRGIGVIAEVMRLPDSGKLGMIRSYCQENAPRIVPVLPAYAIDAPIVAGTASSGSSEETAPITKIVTGITSAAKANQALHRAGLLEQKTRLSRTGEEKLYWCVTELGSKYGKNVTHPNSPLETQPHWYACKSDEIAQIVIDNLDKVQQ